MPNVITVGISDCQVTNDRGATIVTYALGSCIAICAHDPVAAVGGLLHIMLPESEMETDRGRANPCMYADTGIPLLIQRLEAVGASKRRLSVRVAGGAQVLDDGGLFNIGKRNHVSTRKALWKAGLLVQAESVGGNVHRTVWLEVASGRVLVRSGAQTPQELTPVSGRQGAI